MNLNWSNRVIKYVLFVFNLLFVITGIVMIAVGVSVKTYFTEYNFFLDGRYFNLPNLLIATGSLIFFISFFGCCGAIKESWFMIFIFSILLSLIFILEFSAGIAGYVLRDDTRNFLSNELTESMKNYKPIPDNVTTTTYMWDKVQTTFHCCGAKSAEDWYAVLPTVTTTPETTPNNSTPTTPTTSVETTTTVTTTTTTTTTKPDNSTEENGGNKSKRQVREAADPDDKLNLPASCCQSKPGTTGMMVCRVNSTTATVYDEGCIDAFGNYLKAHAVTIGGVGIAIAFIQLFGIIFACHLTKQLKHGFYST